MKEYLMEIELKFEYIENLRAKFPIGTRIQCIKMNDPFNPIESGTIGTVERIDDGGTIHMHWDNGRGLGLIPNEDEFKIVEGKES